MLNPFYWYTLIWSIVLTLYECGFSKLNESLDSTLLGFFLISCSITLLLGFVFRKFFRYRNLTEIPKISSVGTVTIVIVSFLEFIYAKQLPLISIIMGHSSYGDFIGIPLIHTLLANFNIFYSSYLFYLYLETDDKNTLKKIIIQVSMFLLMFQKGSAIISMFVFINLWIAKLRHENKLNIKNITGAVVAILAIIYINGCLANVRNGATWNDNSLAYSVNRISFWPTIIPGQFVWMYAYVTTPLGNLNHLLSLNSGSVNINQVLGTIIPVTILKPLFPTWQVSVNLDDLSVQAMNACTGLVNGLLAAGIVGIYLFWILITIIVTALLLYINRKSNASMHLYALLSMMMTFLFFYDTFTTAITAFLPLLIVCFCWTRKKVKFTWGES